MTTTQTKTDGKTSINKKIEEILLSLNDLWLMMPKNSIVRNDIVRIEREVKNMTSLEEAN